MPITPRALLDLQEKQKSLTPSMKKLLQLYRQKEIPDLQAPSMAHKQMSDGGMMDPDLEGQGGASIAGDDYSKANIVQQMGE